MILSEQEYNLQISRIKERLGVLNDESQEKKIVQKFYQILCKLDGAYGRHRLFIIRQLNNLRKHSHEFKDSQEKAMVITLIELLEKLLFERKRKKY